MLPTLHRAPYGDVFRGQPICLVTSGLHTQYTHTDTRQIGFIPGFSSQDNYSPRDSRKYKSFLNTIDPTAITL